MALRARRSLIPWASLRCATAFRLAAGGVTINGMVRPVLLPHHREVRSIEESIMAHRNLPRSAAIYGIDIGKNVFHVVGLSCDGTPVQKVRFRRDTLLQFFTRAEPSVVGMESCAGSQWLARKIQALGHKGALDPRAIRQALREIKQERYHQRRGDRRGRDAADNAFRRREGSRPGRSPSATPNP